MVILIRDVYCTEDLTLHGRFHAGFQKETNVYPKCVLLVPKLFFSSSFLQSLR